MSYEYIDTDVEYIGTIPKTWDLVRNKHLFNKTKVIVGPNWDKYNVLSLTKKGVIIKDIENNQGKMPSDFSIYQLVNPGNLLMCLFDIDVTPRCVGYIENKGIVSAAYTELAPVEEIDMKYYYWWYLMLDIDKQLLHLSKNLRNSLSTEDFMALSVVKPPIKEQQQIANYLDKQTAKIDATIAKNEELIELLEEKRVALINQVVTKGLDPDIPMKDSGVEWIGEIPEHWEVDCLKHNVILNAKTLTDTTDNDYEFDYVDIGSVSLEKGIEKYEHMSFEDAPSRARRIVKKDDVIISTVRTYLKAIAIIPDKEDIIVSTGFAVLTPNKIDSRYLGYIVKTEYFTNLVSAHSVGVSYPAINSTDLVNLDILIPPNNEQKLIADYLDSEVSNINNIITKVNENIALLEEYKTSLIHHVVTGKIDVRGEEI